MAMSAPMVSSVPIVAPSYFISASVDMWGFAYCDAGAYACMPGAYGFASYHESSNTYPAYARNVKETKAVSGSPHREHEDDNSNVTVVLSNLPKVLCAEACLEAAFQQAHVDDAVRIFSVTLRRGMGEAVVILKSELAAQKTIRHFSGLKWGRASEGITARYCSEAGKQLLHGQQQQQQSQLDVKPEEELVLPKKDFPASPETSRKECKTENANSFPASSVTMRVSKKRWVDMEDGDSDSEGDTESTTTGPLENISEVDDSGSCIDD